MALTAVANLNDRFKNLDPEKLRGGYYTSSEVADWLCRWAIRTRTDTVLEPSCGNGVFLACAKARLIELGATPAMSTRQLTGVEIVETEAHHASRILGKSSNSAAVVHGDFFQWWQSANATYDVAVGNPPFIRYQSFPEPSRSRGMVIIESLGLKPNRLTNIWVPFVAAAVASLRPGGRLAFVLPAELLQVSYASQLRSYLTERFAELSIIACNELFFAGAEQEVILLLADGARVPNASSSCRVKLVETKTVGQALSRNASDLLADAEPKTVNHDNEKWLKYFLQPVEIEFMRELRKGQIASALSKHASVDVGIVTGRNEFFVLTKSQMRDRGLSKYTVPIISRASQLSGARLTKNEWTALSQDDQRVYLLNLNGVPRDRLSRDTINYVIAGERAKINTGYKCSIRDPWYAVPSIWTPDAFLFRQIYDFPRMVLNKTSASCTDTIHRLSCPNPQCLIENTYSHLTAASAEIEGRSYGGGVLELEPTEAERLLVPKKLASALPLKETDRLIRAGRLEEVLRENDKLVLMGQMGLTRSECARLEKIWKKMRDRRFSRRRAPGGVAFRQMSVAAE